jgi:hypothetical protein
MLQFFRDRDILTMEIVEPVSRGSTAGEKELLINNYYPRRRSAMRKRFWFALLIFCFGISGCTCLPWFKCGPAAEEAPPPQPAVVTPAPPPAAVPVPVPPPKPARN